MPEDVLLVYPENKSFLSGVTREIAQLKMAKKLKRDIPKVVFSFFGIILFIGIFSVDFSSTVDLLNLGILLGIAFLVNYVLQKKNSAKELEYEQLISKGKIIDGSFIKLLGLDSDSENNEYSCRIEYEFISPITKKTIRKIETFSRENIDDLKIARPNTKMKILYLSDDLHVVL